MKCILTLGFLIILQFSPCSSAQNSIDEKKKLLFINSYHKGYLWSDGIEKGLEKSLGVKTMEDGSRDVSASRVQIKFFRMNTKINKSESFKKKSALEAKKIIADWSPDIVVACDDNASKYLIAPYFIGAPLPFVFCGVNWDASMYGFPAANITGMIEVAPVRTTLSLLKRYAKGDRIGYIGSNTQSAQKSVRFLKEKENISFSGGKLVNTFSEWRQEYTDLQTSVDMLYWLNPIGIKGWDESSAISFILENTRIPTGTASDAEIRYALIGNTKIAEEQGLWSGKTALRILDGTPPLEIPITRNRGSELYINTKLAKRLGIIFADDIMDRAILF